MIHQQAQVESSQILVQWNSWWMARTCVERQNVWPPTDLMRWVIPIEEFLLSSLNPLGEKHSCWTTSGIYSCQPSEFYWKFNLYWETNPIKRYYPRMVFRWCCSLISKFQTCISSILFGLASDVKGTHGTGWSSIGAERSQREHGTDGVEWTFLD